MREYIPLEVYMLLTGYLSIKSYDRKSDLYVLIDFANEEVKEEIFNGVCNLYVPSEHKVLNELPSMIDTLLKAMKETKIPVFVKTLNEIGYPVY